MTVTADDCAREILEVVPLVMRVVRSEMRSHRGPGLSVPHFRVLAYLRSNKGVSLSEVADYIGLRLPSMSTLVDGLVTRGLVLRGPSPADRRRLTLCLTARGRSTLAAARQDAQAGLARLLTALPPGDQETVAAAMEILGPVFMPGGSRETQ